MNRLLKPFNSKPPRGQGLVETALLLPILLIVLSGLLEFGFLLNEYMVVQDATRNAARFGADLDYNSRDSNPACSATRDFYRQIGCLVNQELAQAKPIVVLDIGTGIDDVVVSVFSVEGGASAQVSDRFPEEDGEAGWSMALDDAVYQTRNQSSHFSTAEISNRLSHAAPSTGYLLVEVFYSYDQKLKLPWITAFLADPVTFHLYAIMPLSSAEPTPTPIP
ncbi:MAG: TadE/TadG family type IV pilus assembly protein [Chloroflexota bacterium]